MLITIFGFFAWGVVPFIQSLPRAFVSMLAGFALIGVLGNSLKMSFSRPKMLLSTSLTFVIAMSPVQFFYISAPVWALVAGTIIANIFEKRGMKVESSCNDISSES
jgi:benzoate membrane transport protein